MAHYQRVKLVQMKDFRTVRRTTFIIKISAKYLDGWGNVSPFLSKEIKHLSLLHHVRNVLLIRNHSLQGGTNIYLGQ